MLGETDRVERHQSKSKKGDFLLPITLWTDLGNKQPPFVEMTEGGIFTDNTAR